MVTGSAAIASLARRKIRSRSMAATSMDKLVATASAGAATPPVIAAGSASLVTMAGATRSLPWTQTAKLKRAAPRRRPNRNEFSIGLIYINTVVFRCGRCSAYYRVFNVIAKDYFGTADIIYGEKRLYYRNKAADNRQKFTSNRHKAMSRIQYLKCSCQQCGEHIEFPADGLGMSILCPHCGRQTRLI